MVFKFLNFVEFLELRLLLLRLSATRLTWSKKNTPQIYLIRIWQEKIQAALVIRWLSIRGFDYSQSVKWVKIARTKEKPNYKHEMVIIDCIMKWWFWFQDHAVNTVLVLNKSKQIMEFVQLLLKAIKSTTYEYEAVRFETYDCIADP